ncbi:MAG: polyprenyl synthetase family protein [Bacteroidetes bacterium]|nr:polyprenyl synthetase family protein [Bacteroidota bacterium]
MANTIDHFHSALKTELDLTQKYIISFSEAKDSLTRKSIGHIVKNKGKMLRPILLILSGWYSYRASNPKSKDDTLFIDDIAKVAAILELIQMSSLIHDDVLDHASVRRNKATLNNLKGNRFAILLGDYLVAQSLKNCYQLIHNAERIFDPVILYSMLDSISKLVLGEVQQNNFNEHTHSYKNGVDKYFEIVENKTASLFSLSCFVGSSIGSRDTKYTEILKQLGHNIGIAYQIIDDIRDFAPTKEISGEKNFQDIRFGIKTLPIIYAFQFSQNGESERLAGYFNSRKDLSKKEKNEITLILTGTQSIERSFRKVQFYISNARQILSQLPENQYSIMLSEMVSYLSESSERAVSDIIKTKP